MRTRCATDRRDTLEKYLSSSPMVFVAACVFPKESIIKQFDLTRTFYHENSCFFCNHIPTEMVPLDQILQLTGEAANALTGDSPPESTEIKKSMRYEVTCPQVNC